MSEPSQAAQQHASVGDVALLSERVARMEAEKRELELRLVLMQVAPHLATQQLPSSQPYPHPQLPATPAAHTALGHAPARSQCPSRSPLNPIPATSADPNVASAPSGPAAGSKRAAGRDGGPVDDSDAAGSAGMLQAKRSRQGHAMAIDTAALAAEPAPHVLCGGGASGGAAPLAAAPPSSAAAAVTVVHTHNGGPAHGAAEPSPAAAPTASITAVAAAAGLNGHVTGRAGPPLATDPLQQRQQGTPPPLLPLLQEQQPDPVGAPGTDAPLLGARSARTDGWRPCAPLASSAADGQGARVTAGTAGAQNSHAQGSTPGTAGVPGLQRVATPSPTARRDPHDSARATAGPLGSRAPHTPTPAATGGPGQPAAAAAPRPDAERERGTCVHQRVAGGVTAGGSAAMEGLPGHAADAVHGRAAEAPGSRDACHVTATTTATPATVGEDPWRLLEGVVAGAREQRRAVEAAHARELAVLRVRAEAAEATLRQRAEAAEAATAELRQRAEAAEATQTELRQRAEAAEATQAELRQRAEAAEAAVSDARHRAEAAEATITELRLRIEAADATHAALRQRAAATQEELRRRLETAQAESRQRASGAGTAQTEARARAAVAAAAAAPADLRLRAEAAEAAEEEVRSRADAAEAARTKWRRKAEAAQAAQAELQRRAEAAEAAQARMRQQVAVAEGAAVAARREAEDLRRQLRAAGLPVQPAPHIQAVQANGLRSELQQRQRWRRQQDLHAQPTLVGGSGNGGSAAGAGDGDGAAAAARTGPAAASGAAVQGGSVGDAGDVGAAAAAAKPRTAATLFASFAAAGTPMRATRRAGKDAPGASSGAAAGAAPSPSPPAVTPGLQPRQQAAPRQTGGTHSRKRREPQPAAQNPATQRTRARRHPPQQNGGDSESGAADDGVCLSALAPREAGRPQAAAAQPVSGPTGTA